MEIGQVKMLGDIVAISVFAGLGLGALSVIVWVAASIIKEVGVCG